MKDIIRMNQLAGIITEGQAKKMLEVLNEGTSEVNELFGLFKKTPFERLQNADNIKVVGVRKTYDDRGNAQYKKSEESYRTYGNMLSGLKRDFYDPAYFNISWEEKNGWNTVEEVYGSEEDEIKNAVEKKFGTK
jgi:hypothetical protein